MCFWKHDGKILEQPGVYSVVNYGREQVHWFKLENIIEQWVEIEYHPEIMNEIVEEVLEIELQIKEPPDIEANTVSIDEKSSVDG